MPRGLKLAPQLLTLVTIPMIFQLGLLAWLGNLQKDAENEAELAIHATLISRAMQKLQKDLTAFAAENVGEKPLRKHRVSLLEFQEQYDSIGRDYVELDKLLADKPTHLNVLHQSELATKQAVQLIRQARESFERAPDDEVKVRRRIFEKLRPFVDQILSDNLIDVGRQFDDMVVHEPEKQALLRKQTHDALIAGLALNFILSAVLALFIIVRVTGRLKRINENAYLFAAGMPMAPELGGGDELAELDKSFHSLVSALEQVVHRERVVVENAHDIILTMNEQGRISTINKACKTMLDCEPEDLIGVYLVELVDASDVARAQDFFNDLQKTPTNEGTIQLKLKWKANPELHTLWSAKFDRTEASTFCVIHDINERMQAEQLRQEILAMVSHDLRSPLSTIQNCLEMLEDGMLGTLTERGAKLTSATQLSCQRMLTLINDLLDIEKIKAGMMPCNIEDVDIGEVMKSAVEPMQEWAQERGVKVEYAPSDATARGDAGKLARVISNLLGNAIKFSPSGGTVKVSAVTRGNEVEVSVADEGKGIPHEMLDSIFDRFKQVTGASIGGSGLGLAICKSFIDLHGGKIWAESVIGKGSTFKFVVPAATSAQSAKSL